jgi:hypothetical protein
LWIFLARLLPSEVPRFVEDENKGNYEKQKREKKRNGFLIQNVRNPHGTAVAVASKKNEKNGKRNETASETKPSAESFFAKFIGDEGEEEMRQKNIKEDANHVNQSP